MNIHILLVMKWLDNKSSISHDELDKSRKVAVVTAESNSEGDDAASIAISNATSSSYAVFSGMSYADLAEVAAKKWVEKYFEYTGEEKIKYIQQIKGSE